jgi:predicted alpha/beta hydrolase
MTDWVDYDGAGAITWLRERFPYDEILGISHSIGAFVSGGAPNAAEQARLVLIGPHTAYFGDYRALYRLPMTVLWHGLMPAVTRMVGYFPGHRLRLGEDLPAGIALQWAARWSRRLRPTGGERERERTRQFLAHCATLQRPALTITVSDDAFATLAGAKGLLSHFPQLAAQRVVLSPADANVQHLGHFGFFRRDAGAILWPRLLAFLEGRG